MVVGLPGDELMVRAGPERDPAEWLSEGVAFARSLPPKG